MSEWQPVETAPKDGTEIDLWMVEENGDEYREADAYWVNDHSDVEHYYDDETHRIETRSIRRSGWYGPNHDYDGNDGWADRPRWFNAHPRQQKWVETKATHWMPRPSPPTP